MTHRCTILARGIALAVAGTALATAPPQVRAQSAGADADPALASHVVEVTAEDFAFRVPETLPSGWTTIRFANEGEEHHLLYLVRLPDGTTFDDYMIEAGEAYNAIWYGLRDGELDEEGAWEQAAETLPRWIGDLEPMGGSGLVAPGGTAEVTVRLEPGDYVVECYMRSADGEIHAIEGMAHPLTVTDEASGGTPPSADAIVTLSNDGIEIEGELAPGRRTIEVRVADQGPAFGHDLHLARLDDGMEVDGVLGWEKWMTAEGMRHPAPATFVGGVQFLPVGGRGFFTTELQTGRYLMLSESGIWRELTLGS